MLTEDQAIEKARQYLRDLCGLDRQRDPRMEVATIELMNVLVEDGGCRSVELGYEVQFGNGDTVYLTHETGRILKTILYTETEQPEEGGSDETVIKSLVSMGRKHGFMRVYELAEMVYAASPKTGLAGRIKAKRRDLVAELM